MMVEQITAAHCFKSFGSIAEHYRSFPEAAVRSALQRLAASLFLMEVGNGWKNLVSFQNKTVCAPHLKCQKPPETWLCLTFSTRISSINWRNAKIRAVQQNSFHTAGFFFFFFFFLIIFCSSCCSPTVSSCVTPYSECSVKPQTLLWFLKCTLWPKEHHQPTIN